MKQLKRFLCFVWTILMTVMCFGCNYIFGDNKQWECSIQAVSPLENEEKILVNEDIYNWYTQYDSKDDLFSSGLYNPEWKDNFFPVEVQLQWQCLEVVDYFVVKVGTDAQLKDAVEYTSSTNFINLQNLFVATKYYWQVEAVLNQKKDSSPVFSFCTASTPRTIQADGVSNIRDIGGVMTSSGNRIQQGLVYRGARLETMTAEGKKVLHDDLKIKTELDLRNPVTETNGRTIFLLGRDINYININAHDVYYDLIFSNPEIIKAEMEVFANIENYPVYFHCSAGRDRTGALAYLLEALCGVDELELYKDFELTFFSSSGCSDFDRIDNQLCNLVNWFDRMNEYMKTNYQGETLQKKVENYLLSIGVSIEQIETIQCILLGLYY